MKNPLYIVAGIALMLRPAIAQTTFPDNGAANPNHTLYAFTNTVLHVDYETTLNNGTLLIQDGKVVAVGEKLSIPKEAVVYDLRGKHIYPSFIDLYSDYGIPEQKRRQDHGWGPQLESNIKGAYGWNQAIRSDVEAYKVFVHQPAKADELRKQGFGVVLTGSHDGIVRGNGALVAVANTKENECILKDKAAGLYSFDKGSSGQDYPSSLTGAIALLRQTYMDAKWYASNASKTEYNISLDMFNQLQNLPSIFDAGDKYNDVRADKIGDEFKVLYLIKGGGNEYQRMVDIEATHCPYILPLNFPEAMDVEDPYDADQVSLTDLKHWEMAPSNPAALDQANINFCFTTSDLKDKSQFLKNLRKAVLYGLSEKAALKALTHNPAQFMGVLDKVGALKAGMQADFFIASKSIFDDNTTLYDHWVNGIQHKYGDLQQPDIKGIYTLNLSGKAMKLILNDEGATVFIKDSTKTKANYSLKNDQLTLSFAYDSAMVARLNGTLNEADYSIQGKGQYADGTWFDFTIKRQAADTTTRKGKKVEKPDFGKVYYPFGAYGEPLPESQGFVKDLWNKYKNRYDALLIKDATVWTNEGDSVLKEYDVYVTEGKIVRIAPNIDALKSAYAKVIDAKGMHLTAGIIDEHSHIALSGGVNEGTQASSAEVRMGDVINPEDINIYRQLAGGVTTAQLLHGSANPIGGQSVLIKLRWGRTADDLKYDQLYNHADGFIKFALGENVKQSNWGDFNTVRFPQTRMGVEQVYYDYFTRAKAYKKQMEDFSDMSSRKIEKNKIVAPRPDLELQALVEILDNKRFITCHSYVQSEVNMLMHVADSMKFKVNTFTHILEGYKVADKLKAHGANASTFADWWAYKMEVMEAIPYNAAILTREGVNTCINSDDAEMGRRLNQEAAKTVKYGGLSETEALKLVTLNPAKALHIDNRVGSIKVGKVADLVLWTDHPLSIYAKVDKTIIDGLIYYDREDDAKLRENLIKERARIINKLILEKHKGTHVIKPQPKKQHLYHCDTMEEDYLQFMNEN